MSLRERDLSRKRSLCLLGITCKIFQSGYPPHLGVLQFSWTLNDYYCRRHHAHNYQLDPAVATRVVTKIISTGTDHRLIQILVIHFPVE